MGIFKLNGVDYMGGSGGGGNSNEQSLSYAEYLALSEAEKTNDTNYYIYDINGDGQEFQPIIYSEEEREVGVWTDGKPLYQKTITLTPTSSIVAIQHDIANVDLIVDIKGVGVRSDYGVVPANCARSSNLVGVWADRTNVGFSISNTDYVSAPFILTLQYTKTTDSPGSGAWTPQGVPTHHYSTSEQIIGTWIDGSTVYEKVVETTFNNASPRYTLDLSTMDGTPITLIDASNSFLYYDNNGTQIVQVATQAATNYTSSTLTYNHQQGAVTGKAYVTIRYIKREVTA